MAAKFSFDTQAFKQQLWRFKRHLSKRVLVLEFLHNSLILAQFQLLPNSLKLCGYARESLPSGAVERGVPKDPQLMAELIKSLCREQMLVGHRAVVVLPPEAVHLSSHWLPAGHQIEYVQQWLLDPTSPVQLPFPLEQTDFDVLPNRSLVNSDGSDLQLWSVMAVASRLSDRVLQCLQFCDTECRRIDTKALSLIRPVASLLRSLQHGQTALILDLGTDQTHVTIATADGPIQVERLTAIREYPHSDEDAQRNYLPLGEIDLKAFVADLNHLIANIDQNTSVPQSVALVVLTGVNSAHPDLQRLLASMISLEVVELNLFASPALKGIEQLSLTESCFMHSIVGAALGLLPHLSNDHSFVSRAPFDERPHQPESTDLVIQGLHHDDEHEGQIIESNLDVDIELAMYESNSDPAIQLSQPLEEPSVSETSTPDFDDSSTGLSAESALPGDSDEDNSGSWPSIIRSTKRQADLPTGDEQAIANDDKAADLDEEHLVPSSSELSSVAKDVPNAWPTIDQPTTTSSEISSDNEPAPATPWLDDLPS